MAVILPEAARQALRFEEKVLQNGLTLRLAHMPDYSAVHAIYATDFGSIDRAFAHGGKTVQLPAGVAHFLEHKMFENEDGVDAFALYAKTGASANAYTSFDRTSYIFTATDKIAENLDILLGFVGHPHFTKATVEKEQGIIGQEIMMYQDNAELRCYFAMLECLYQNHPVRDEIVGTVETIAGITPDMLYDCCNAFYAPSNMALCAAGNITMPELEAAVARVGLPQEKTPAPVRIFPEEPTAVCEKERTFAMPVAMPVFALGFKETPEPNGLSGAESAKTDILCDLVTELLAGEASPLYRRLYDEGLVQPGFGGEFGNYNGALHLVFSGEGPDPARVRDEVCKEIRRQKKEGIDKALFETCRRMMYGESVAELENVSRVASQLAGSLFRRRTPADELAALAAVTADEVQEALCAMLDEDNAAFAVVEPVE